jgi:TolB protein
MMLRPWFAAVCLAAFAGTAVALVFALSGGSGPSVSHAARVAHATSACTDTTGRLAGRHRAGSDTIAFVRYARGSYAIFVMSARGGSARRLSAPPAVRPSPQRQFFQDAPTWSPDGKSIAFASDRDGRYGVYVMRADGTHTRLLSVSSAGDLAPAWSPDGRLIAFSRATKGLYVIGVDGRGATELTHAPNVKDTDPAWSPDGTRIVFVRHEPGIGSALFLIRKDGRGLCELTSFTTSVDAPAWSPDGRKLAYSTGDGRGFGIAVVNANGTGLRTLTPQGLDFHPAWSPDGHQIAFAREATLYVMNQDGSHIRRLTPLRAIDGNPAWRPTA